MGHPVYVGNHRANYIYIATGVGCTSLKILAVNDASNA